MNDDKKPKTKPQWVTYPSLSDVAGVFEIVKAVEQNKTNRISPMQQQKHQPALNIISNQTSSNGIKSPQSNQSNATAKTSTST